MQRHFTRKTRDKGQIIMVFRLPGKKWWKLFHCRFSQFFHQMPTYSYFYLKILKFTLFIPLITCTEFLSLLATEKSIFVCRQAANFSRTVKKWIIYIQQELSNVNKEKIIANWHFSCIFSWTSALCFLFLFFTYNCSVLSAHYIRKFWFLKTCGKIHDSNCFCYNVISEYVFLVHMHL